MPTVDIPITRDTKLALASPTTNYGSASDGTALEVNSYSESVKHTSLLAADDLSSIPAGSTIDSVQLLIVASDNTLSGTHYIDLHQLLVSWTEDAATWNSRNGTNAWNTGGAVGSGSDRSATTLSTIAGSGLGSRTFDTSADFVALMQGWLDGTITNNGIVAKRRDLTVNDVTYIAAHSSEAGTAGNRPFFRVVYTAPATPPTATLAGTLDTITGAITAGAADISATLAGALDTITGNLAAGGNTGRLTSTLPLRDAARLVLANRNDLVVHVLGKPGLGSVILLNPQSTNSGGFWTAPGPFIPGNRYNVMYELAGEPIGCEIITAGAV